MTNEPRHHIIPRSTPLKNAVLPRNFTMLPSAREMQALVKSGNATQTTHSHPFMMHSMLLRKVTQKHNMERDVIGMSIFYNHIDNASQDINASPDIIMGTKYIYVPDALQD